MQVFQTFEFSCEKPTAQGAVRNNGNAQFSACGYHFSLHQPLTNQQCGPISGYNLLQYLVSPGADPLTTLAAVFLDSFRLWLLLAAISTGLASMFAPVNRR